MPETRSAPRDVSELLTELEPLVTQTVRRRLRGWPRDLHDDVAQEVRLRLWRALPSFDPARGQLEPYAQTIICNAIRDQLDTLRTARPNFTVLESELLTAPAPSLDELRDGLNKNQLKLLGLLLAQSDRAELARQMNIPIQRLYERIGRLRHRVESRNAS